MEKLNKNILLNKLEYAVRLLYVNTITHVNNSVLVVEYPKSGGTWLAQLISGILNIPFPRNTFPTTSRALYHSHYQPKYLIDKNKKIVLLIRDGRDIIVSSYFHYLIWNDKNKQNPKLVNYYRNNLQFEDYDDIRKNLPKFIEFMFKDEPSRLKFFNYPGNWTTYNKKWLKRAKNQSNIFIIKYEDLLGNANLQMKNLIDYHFNFDNENVDERIKEVVFKYSFENQTKRHSGVEDKSNFLRKGIAGDWKNYFNEEAKDVFKKYGGSMLIQLGYEENNEW